MKVLWIDPNLSEIKAYMDKLKEMFEVIHVSNQDDALEMLKFGSEEFSCVITEIWLPHVGKIKPAESTGVKEAGIALRGEVTARQATESSYVKKAGFVLEEKIREIQKYKDIPVIMFTRLPDSYWSVRKYSEELKDHCFFKNKMTPEEFLREIYGIIPGD